MRKTDSHFNKWRKYQTRLQREARRSRYLRKLTYLIFIPISALVVLAAVAWASFWISDRWSQRVPAPPVVEKKHVSLPPTFSRNEIPDLLNDINYDVALLSDVFECEKNGKPYTIRTTIDTKLQRYIQRMLKRSRTLQSAVVVLGSTDGRVLAMVDRDTNGRRTNLNLKADYPAASLFKIVSAEPRTTTADCSVLEIFNIS